MKPYFPFRRRHIHIGKIKTFISPSRRRPGVRVAGMSDCVSIATQQPSASDYSRCYDYSRSGLRYGTYALNRRRDLIEPSIKLAGQESAIFCIPGAGVRSLSNSHFKVLGPALASIDLVLVQVLLFGEWVG